MKINKINRATSLNYKGYNKVIATAIYSPSCHISCLSLNLDNISNKDLDLWQRIQHNFGNKSEQSESIVISCQNLYNTAKIWIHDRMIRTFEKPINFSKVEETPILQLCSFVANITKRIANGEQESTNSKSSYNTKFIQQFVQSMLGAGYEEKYILALLNLSLYKTVPKEQIAWEINQNIQDTMNKYFE